MSLRARLLLPLILLGGLIAIYLYVFWIPRTLQADEAAHLRAVDSHLNSVAETLVPLLLGNQLDILHGNLNALKQDNTDWRSIRLADAQGRQLYPLVVDGASRQTADLTDVRTLEKQVRYLNELLGTLIVEVDLAPSLENTRREITEIELLLLGMLGGLMLAILVTTEAMVTRPVHQLSVAAERLARMQFDTQLPATGTDEVGKLVRSFTSMRDDLQQNHEQLLREIAERREAEESLRQLNITLEQRVRDEVAANRDKDHLLIQQSRLAAMGEMVHNIAHQWRQPLNALSLLLSNIVEDFRFKTMTAESLEHDAATARRLIEKMSTTIDDFRDFFRPDREQADFDVAEPVHEAIFIIDASLKANHIELEADTGTGLMASGFPSQYGQAVLNLLVNAKEAILNCRQSNGRIRVTLARRDNDAILTVDDNGGGIPEDILPHLFEPYFTTKEQGTGIGLYMAKMIIERNMHGAIRAENIEGGARFTLTIPLEQNL